MSTDKTTHREIKQLLVREKRPKHVLESILTDNCIPVVCLSSKQSTGLEENRSDTPETTKPLFRTSLNSRVCSRSRVERHGEPPGPHFLPVGSDRTMHAHDDPLSTRPGGRGTPARSSTVGKMSRSSPSRGLTKPPGTATDAPRGHAKIPGTCVETARQTTKG